MSGSNSGRYEYRLLKFGSETSRSESRQLLADHAEYGSWELSRTILGMGGRRSFWLRRKIIRVRRTI